MSGYTTNLERGLVDLAKGHFAALNRFYTLMIDYDAEFHWNGDVSIDTPQANAFSDLLDGIHNLQAGFGNYNEHLLVDHGIGSFYDMVGVEEDGNEADGV